MWSYLRFLHWRTQLPKPCSGNTVAEHFCTSILGEVSRSFRLAIPLLPTPELRTEVSVFYLALRALDTLEDDTSMPPSVRQRCLQHFPLCLGPEMRLPAVAGEGAEQELLQKFPYVQQVYSTLEPAAQDIILDVTTHMAAGMQSEVRRQGVRSLQEYNGYCQLVAGLVGEGLTHLFVESGY